MSERFKDVAKRLHDNGYKPLPVHYGSKSPIGNGWQNYEFKPSHLKKFAEEGTGLLCGAQVAADIDVLDPGLAAELEALAVEILGEGLRRVGKSPKLAVLYRAEEPFAKIQTTAFRLPTDPEISPTFKGHKVEILAQGQHLNAFNKHPETGLPYTWTTDRSPLTVKASDLPAVTEEQCTAFRDAAEKCFLAAGALRVGRLTAKNANRAGSRNERLTAENPEECIEALMAIPNENEGYDDWITVMYAVKGALGDAGFEAFEKWSAKSAKHDPLETEKYWARTKANRSGAGTIYFLAREHGWSRTITVEKEDFYAYMPSGQYLFEPTRELWPADSVNKRLDDKLAAMWIGKDRPIDQMTWAPGESPLIRNRLVVGGGWIVRKGSDCFNLYLPPTVKGGDATKADRWVKHIQRIYPTDWQHIVWYLAHRVQRPGEKINHALVLGGAQGIGKDSILEPVKAAIGPWNFNEVSPSQLLGRFNGWVKSVILRVSEARDLGDVDRYAFYDHTKIYNAAPPDVLRCDEKNLREHSVFNVLAMIITSNHKVDGIFLPPDDRRHYVAWSEEVKENFTPEYWNDLYSWYANGGTENVAAYLAALDLKDFDPKAPPPKTPAFWDIVEANRSPESAEMAELIETLENPNALTIAQLIEAANDKLNEFANWLRDRRNAKKIPHRLEDGGYVVVRNEDNKRDGLWSVGGRKVMVYARKELSVRDRIAAAQRLAGPKPTAPTKTELTEESYQNR